MSQMCLLCSLVLEFTQGLETKQCSILFIMNLLHPFSVKNTCVSYTKILTNLKSSSNYLCSPSNRCLSSLPLYRTFFSVYLSLPIYSNSLSPTTYFVYRYVTLDFVYIYRRSLTVILSSAAVSRLQCSFKISFSISSRMIT